MKNFTRFLPFLLALLLGFSASGANNFGYPTENSAAAPANDNCAGAISLPVSVHGACSYTAVSTVDATQSAPNPTCTSSGNNDDVWYTFTPTVSGVHTIQYNSLVVVTGTAFGLGYALYTGSCGALTSVGCSSAFTTSTATASLTAGTTYYLRVWLSVGGNSGTWNMCIESPAPANDLCSGATVITNGSVINMTTAGATNEVAAEAPTCNSISNTTNGVWFLYTAAANTSGALTLSGCNTTFDSRVKVYTTANGLCPGAGNVPTCVTGDDNDDCNGPGNGGAETTTFNYAAGATPVNYYVYMSGNSGTLDFSIVTIPPPACATLNTPANGATNVARNTPLTWTPPVGGSTPTAYKVYLGTTNPPATLVATVVAPTTTYTPTGQTYNTVYYWYVVPTNSIGDATGCGGANVFSYTTGGLANDNCSGAIPLPVSVHGACSYTAVSTVDATQSTPNPTCTASGNNDDVWYTFTPTVSGVHTIQYNSLVVVTGSAFGLGYALYTGSCGSLTSIGCSSAFTTSTTTASLTAGTTYYLRVWLSLGANSGTWNMCIESPAPANDLCSGATVITNGSVINMSTAGATNEVAAEAPTCGGISNTTNGVWFLYTAAAGTSGALTLSGCNTTFDSRVKVYTTASGLCPGAGNVPTCVTGDDNDDCNGPGNGGAEITTFNYAAPAFGPHGAEVEFAPVNYYIYMSGGNGTLDFTVSGVVLPLELESFTGEIIGNLNKLNWKTLTEKNVQSHIVERSVDATRWLEVGRVAGKGDSQVAVKYSLEDRVPLAKAYYRLRSVDFDGKENLSNSIVLTRKGDQFAITSVYPSPTTEKVTVQFNATAAEEVTIRVMDMTGRLVMQQITESVKDINELPITLTGLQAGLYSVTVSNSTTVSAPVRFVKQ